jgi:hypothetical protein
MIWNQVSVEGRRRAAAPFASSEQPSLFGASDANEIAVDAYTYAYPMVLMDVIRRFTSNVEKPDRELGTGAPVNEFTHLRRMPDTTVEHPPHPNPDTLCSSLWFDVSREPLIVNVPEAAGRFFTLSLLDHWSDVFAAPGARTTGGLGQTFGIVGPSWSGRLPAGIREYRSPTALGWLVAETELRGAADLASVARFQAGLSATPFQHWGRLYTPSRPAVEAGLPSGNPVEIVARMGAREYFSRFCELTRKNPPHPHDYPLLDRMRRIGISPGHRFNVAALPSEVRRALERAPLLAVPGFKEAYEHTGQVVNYWRSAAKPCGVYGTDFAVRAGVAHAAFGSHANNDAASCRASRDGDGDPLDSSLRYTLTFSKYALPPARAFWSLSLYDDQKRLAINPLGRYSIGDRDDLRPNRDGSVTINIQRSFPGPERENNWLPAPRSGGFNLDMRLYWPAPDALNGHWCPPVVRRSE